MTSPDPADPDLATRAADLTRAVDRLAKRVERNRIIIIGLAVSLVFDLLMSLGLIVTYNRVNDACIASNESAAKQHQLWAGLLALPSSGPPAEPAVLVAFNKLLDDTFTQKDCS